MAAPNCMQLPTTVTLLGRACHPLPKDSGKPQSSRYNSAAPAEQLVQVRAAQRCQVRVLAQRLKVCEASLHARLTAAIARHSTYAQHMRTRRVTVILSYVLWVTMLDSTGLHWQQHWFWFSKAAVVHACTRSAHRAACFLLNGSRHSTMAEYVADEPCAIKA